MLSAAPPVVVVDYIAAVDEFTMIVADASDIEIFEPMEDLELIFDATQAGALLGLTMRGARLGRPPTWLRTAEILCGPSVWRAFQGLVAAGGATVVGEDDQDSVSVRVRMPAQEWARLRTRTWLGLHQALHDGEWWSEQFPAPAAMVPAGADPEAPWVIVASWPREGAATNLALPEPLARRCGLEPTGYVRRHGRRVEIRFDLIAQQERPADASGTRAVSYPTATQSRPTDASLALAVPYATTRSATVDDGELLVMVDCEAPVGRTGSFMVVAEATVVRARPPRVQVINSELRASEGDLQGQES